MLAILLRHYRRFAVFSGGIAVLGTVGLCAAGYYVSLVGTVSLFIFAFVASIVMAFGLYAVAPRYRGFLEIIGIAAILASILVYNASGYLTSFTQITIVSVLLSALIAGLLWYGLYSKISRKIGAETTWRERHSGHVPYPARLVWRHIVPGAAEPSDHCTGLMARYDEDPDDADTVHVTFKGRSGRVANYSLTFLEREKPESCRFFFQGNEADGTPVDGIFSLRLTVLDRNTCFLSCVEERVGLCIGSLVELWFDDRLGFQHVKLLEKLGDLYGDRYPAATQYAVNAD